MEPQFRGFTPACDAVGGGGLVQRRHTGNVCTFFPTQKWGDKGHEQNAPDLCLRNLGENKVSRTLTGKKRLFFNIVPVIRNTLAVVLQTSILPQVC